MEAVARNRPNPGRIIETALGLARLAREFASASYWLSFDKETDLLYVGLKKPPGVTKTVELNDEGILLDYSGNELVGITVLDASQR